MDDSTAKATLTAAQALHKPRTNPTLPLGPAVGAGLIAFWMSFGPVVLFPTLFFEIPLPGVLMFGAAVLSSATWGIPRLRCPVNSALTYTLLLLLTIYIASDLPLRHHGFTEISSIRLALVVIAVGTALAAVLKVRTFLWAVTLATWIGAILGVLWTTQGGLIFSDDHPSFLFRLIQLKENFPAIPFYNPLWNVGVEAREFFPSGVLNFFFLFSPLIYAFDVTTIYTYLVILLMFVALPLSGALAARLAGYNTSVVLLSVTFILTSSSAWYRWALTYGTLGFIVSAGLVTLNIALIARYLNNTTNFRWPESVAIVVTLTLMFLWSPSILLFGPLGVLVCLHIRTILKNPLSRFVLPALFILNLSWIIIFVQASNVASFVSSPLIASESHEQADHSVQIDLSKKRIEDPDLAEIPTATRILRLLRTHLFRINPLVLCLGLIGMIFIENKIHRQLYIVCALSAVILGTLGPIIKPQLELERMWVVLGIILTLPAAVAAAKLLHLEDIRRSLRYGTRIILGILALSPFWIGRVTTNQMLDKYRTASPLVAALTEAIKTFSDDGRTIFAGFSLHELSGGHVAPLAAWTGKPMIATSFQHDRWRYTDVVPEEYRSRKDEGMLEYLDLMNVTTIITHDRFWRKWYSARPKHFQRVWKDQHFVMFRRLAFESNYFLSGAGQITGQSSNSVTVRLDSDSAVLKLNYLPFLIAEDKRGVRCNIQGKPVGAGVLFVHLAECPKDSAITIRAQGPWKRFFELPWR